MTEMLIESPLREIDSDAPTLEPITVNGWYKCTDGTWVYYAEIAQVRLGKQRKARHYNRPMTDDEWRDRVIPPFAP